MAILSFALQSMADIARLLNIGGVDSSAVSDVIADYFALGDDPDTVAVEESGRSTTYYTHKQIDKQDALL